jgi:uncharacterized protein YndB with AHSA1/START domain
MTTKNETTTEAFVLTRIVNAPQQLVWDAFTKAEHLKHWWGPVGLQLNVKQVDLRPDGLFHFSMTTPDGIVMWAKFVYREIVPTTKLVYVLSFSDERGGFSRQPGAPDWPMEMLTVLRLEEQNGKTLLSMHVTAINATAEEIKTFKEGFASMEEGFGGTFDQLDAYLKTIHHSSK